MSQFTQEQQSAMRRYENIKLQIKELEADLELVKPTVLEAVSALPEKTEVNMEHGVFSLVSRSTWKYSDAIKSSEESLKEAKKSEERDGTAKQTINNILMYKQK